MLSAIVLAVLTMAVVGAVAGLIYGTVIEIMTRDPYE
jgi:hypothetical protein